MAHEIEVDPAATFISRTSEEQCHSHRSQISVALDQPEHQCILVKINMAMINSTKILWVDKVDRLTFAKYNGSNERSSSIVVNFFDIAIILELSYRK